MVAVAVSLVLAELKLSLPRYLIWLSVSVLVPGLQPHAVYYARLCFST